jgi:hypothetical protein
MRSFVALMTCIGCIAWIHSCEKRLLGVRLEDKNLINNQAQPLPVAVTPATAIAPALSVSLVTIPAQEASLVAAAIRRSKKRLKKRVDTENIATDSMLFTNALVRGRFTVFPVNTP